MLQRHPNRGATHRLINWVRNGTPRVPSILTRWIPDRTRYEDTTALYQIQPSSLAALAHQFTMSAPVISSHRTNRLSTKICYGVLGRISAISSSMVVDGRRGSTHLYERNTHRFRTRGYSHHTRSELSGSYRLLGRFVTEHYGVVW